MQLRMASSTGSTTRHCHTQQLLLLPLLLLL
jgi:hypothetical protein